MKYSFRKNTFITCRSLAAASPTPTALKALAHPLRLALLERLGHRGAADRQPGGDPARGVPVQLLLAPAQARRARLRPRGPRRHRPQPALAARSAQGLEWGDDADDARTADPRRIAADALTDLLVEREVQRLRAARASREPSRPPGGRSPGCVLVDGLADGRGGGGAAGAAHRRAGPAPRAVGRAVRPSRAPAGRRPPRRRWWAGWSRPVRSGHPGRSHRDAAGVPHAGLPAAVRRPGRQHVRRLADADRAEHVGQDADRLQRRRGSHVPLR